MKKNALALYKKYTDAVGIDLIHSLHHFSVYKMLEKWGYEITLESIPQRLTQEQISASTFNERKRYLGFFYDWLVRNKYIKFNIIRDLKSRKVRTTIPDNHKPFSEHEIVSILNALKTNQFCPANNQFKHSHYYLYVKFMFHTGVRVGEASALKWSDLDLFNKTALIEHSYGRKTTGWGSKHVIRGAKSESERTIQLTDEIVQDLTIARHSTNSKYVFTGPRGSLIQSQNFNNRVLYPILDGLQIKRRVIYAARHTYVSLAVHQQVSLSELQQQVGHKTINTTIKYYTQFKRSPKVNISLPNHK